MFRRTRIAAAGALLAGLFGASVFAAPAAQAASHHVSASWKHWGQYSVTVNGHSDYLFTMTADSKKVVHVSGKTYAAALYRVTVTREGSKKAKFSDRVSPVKALFLYHAFTTTPVAWKTSFPTSSSAFKKNAPFGSTRWTTSTLKHLKHFVTANSSASLAGDYASYKKELGIENTIESPSATLMAENSLIDEWIDDQAGLQGSLPSSFASWTSPHPLDQIVDGVSYTVTGTPRSHTVKATLPSGVWVGFETVYTKTSIHLSDPVAAAASTSANNPYTWSAAH